MSAKTYQSGWVSEAFAVALTARRAHHAIIELGRLAWKYLRKHRAHQYNYQQLPRMSAYALLDIGLTSSDIPAVVDGSYFFDASRQHRYGEFRSVLCTTK